jgi:hypothetical protein
MTPNEIGCEAARRLGDRLKRVKLSPIQRSRRENYEDRLSKVHTIEQLEEQAEVMELESSNEDETIEYATVLAEVAAFVRRRINDL